MSQLCPFLGADELADHLIQAAEISLFCLLGCVIQAALLLTQQPHQLFRLRGTEQLLQPHRIPEQRRRFLRLERILVLCHKETSFFVLLSRTLIPIICNFEQEVTVLKIVVFSDSHGDIANMVDVIEREHPNAVFHLGDHIRDAEELQWAYPELTITRVVGNCDWRSKARSEVAFTIEGVRVFLCHGHEYGVKSGLGALAWRAKEEKAQVALFGHTHQSHHSQKMGIHLCNPGSCGMGMNPTYAILMLEKGTFRFIIRPVFEEA